MEKSHTAGWHAVALSFLMLVALPSLGNAQSIGQQSNPEHKTNPVIGSTFIGVSTALLASTVYDVETTFYALDRCPDPPGCHENNLTMRWAIDRGRPTTYALEGAADAAVLYTAYRLKKDDHWWWWLPPVFGTAVHATAGTLNIRMATSWK